MAIKNNRGQFPLTTQTFIDAVRGNKDYYSHFKKYMTVTAYGFLSDWKVKADDYFVSNIVDETITDCWTAISRGKTPSNMRQYLRTALKNALLDALKIDSRKQSLDSFVKGDNYECENEMLLDESSKTPNPKYGYRDNNTVEDSLAQADKKLIAEEVFEIVKNRYGDNAYRMLQVKYDWELSESDKKRLATLFLQKKAKDSSTMTFLSQELGWSTQTIKHKIYEIEKKLKIEVQKQYLNQYKDVMSWIPEYQLCFIQQPVDMSDEEAAKLFCYLAFLQENVNSINLPYCKRLPVKETLGEETLEYFEKIENYIFSPDESDEIKSMAEVRKHVELIITDREPIYKFYQAEINSYNDLTQKIEDRIKEMRIQSREADEPIDRDTLTILKSVIADNNAEIERINKEFSTLGPDWENYLGIYTHCFPVLNITKPTIILFRDAIEANSWVSNYDLEERSKRRKQLFSVVYAHELFHGYYDSPTFDKVPDHNLEETMANFGMLVLINNVFKERQLKMCAEYISDNLEHFEYYFGHMLYEQTENYNDRLGMIKKYRELSKFIDLSCNYSDACGLYKEVRNQYKVFEYIEQILSIDKWDTWFYLGQLPRFHTQ